MEEKIQSLRCVLLRPCDPSSLGTKDFEAVFQFWETHWKQTYDEVGKPIKQLSSDDLTRQHEVIALFDGDIAIACVCHRYVDMGANSTYRDSYFSSPWTEREHDLLRAQGGKGLIGSQILVHRDYRRRKYEPLGVGLRELISMLSMLHVEQSEAEIVVGTMRVDRGMHSLFYRSGAKALAQGRMFANAEVDLVVFHPKKTPFTIPDTARLFGKKLLMSIKSKNSEAA